MDGAKRAIATAISEDARQTKSDGHLLVSVIAHPAGALVLSFAQALKLAQARPIA